MAWFFLSRMLASAITLVVLLVLTRLLGPSGFGLYNIIVLSGTVAYAVVFGWSATAIIRFHSAPEFRGKALPMAIGSLIVLLVLLVPMAGVVSQMLPAGLRVPVFLATAFCLAHALHEISSAGLRVYLAGPAFAASILLRPLIGLALVVVLLIFGGDYASAVLGMACGAAITGGIALVPVVRRSGIAKPEIRSVGKFVAFGTPLAIVTSAGMVQMLMSQGVLAWRESGLDAVGVFAAASTLSMRSISMPMSMLSRATSASVFKAYEEGGSHAAQSVLDLYFSFLLLVSMPVMMTVAFASRTVAELLFDPSFSAAMAQHLPLLALAAFISGIQGAYFAFSFMISRRTTLQLLITVAITAAHALFTALFVLVFGNIGVSLAVLATMVLGTAAFIAIGGRVHPVVMPASELRKMALALLAGAPIAVMADFSTGTGQAVGLIALSLLSFGAVLLMLRYRALMMIVSRLRRALPRRGESST